MAKPAKLIVLMAFDEDEDGEIKAAFEPRQYDSEERAIREARQISGFHAGVIAWSREAQPDIGEYGEPTELYRTGRIPEME